MSPSIVRRKIAEGETIMAIARSVADACRRHGMRAGIPCAADQVSTYQKIGFTFFNVISDDRCVVNGVKQALATARG